MGYNPPGFRIMSIFAVLREIDKGKAHGGVDYSAPAGTPIPAFAAGKVVRSEVLGRYGPCSNRAAAPMRTGRAAPP